MKWATPAYVDNAVFTAFNLDKRALYRYLSDQSIAGNCEQ